MVSQPHNTLIKFLKGFGREPAQSINSLQVVKRSKVISVYLVVMNETAGSLYGNVTLDMVWVMDGMLLNQSSARSYCNTTATQVLTHCRANLVKIRRESTKP